MTSAGLVRVNAPAGFANALLNGSEGVVVQPSAIAPTVLLLSGPHAGREWQFQSDHLEPLAVDEAGA